MALGGPHTYENTQCAHRKCNRRKGGRRAIGQLQMFKRITGMVGGVESLRKVPRNIGDQLQTHAGRFSKVRGA